MSDLVGNPEDRFSRVAAHWISLSLLSNDSVYARIGTVDSGENRIGKSFKMAEGADRREVNR